MQWQSDRNHHIHTDPLMSYPPDSLSLSLSLSLSVHVCFTSSLAEAPGGGGGGGGGETPLSIEPHHQKPIQRH